MKGKLLMILAGAALLAGCGAAVSAAAPQPTEQPAAEVKAPAPAPVTVMGRPEETMAEITPGYRYTLADVRQVGGRQGIAADENYYYVSGSTTLQKFDKDWNLLEENNDPFAEFEIKVNHLGDIDVYNGEIYAGAENFNDGAATDIQIAVYDAETLTLKRTFLFEPSSGQLECSGVAVDPDHNAVWMCSWVGEESGRYLYRYDLTTGEYVGKVHLQCPPQWLQGIAYDNGYLYMTADDGTADLGEPDHVYRCFIDPEATTATVTLERTLDDVTLQGEIEGISIDRDKNQMLISYNRGSQIVLGMVRGFYEGYEEEIHEIFVYDRS